MTTRSEVVQCEQVRQTKGTQSHTIAKEATALEKNIVHEVGDQNKTMHETLPELQVQGKDEERNTVVPAGRVMYGFTHTACPKKKTKNQYETSSSQQPEKVTCLAARNVFE